MRFCGPDNAGQIVDDHFFGYVWLKMDSELIDFPCGDWQNLDHRARLFGRWLGPIRLDAPADLRTDGTRICSTGSPKAHFGMARGTVSSQATPSRR
jgi:hypothetical protein